MSVVLIVNPHNYAYKQAIIRVRILTYYEYICGTEKFFSNHRNTQRIPHLYGIRGFIKMIAGTQHRSLSKIKSYWYKSRAQPHITSLRSIV